MPVSHNIDPNVPNYQDLVTAGIYARTFPSAIWAAPGSSILATGGTDTACTNGTAYISPVFIPYVRTLTGVFYQIGSVGGTDSVIVALYDDVGAVLANSALAGTVVGTAANIQKVPFTAAYTTTRSGLFWISCTFNGTTAKFRSYPIPGTPFNCGSEAETFGTVTAITPPTSFTADKGPIGGVYV